MALVMKSKDELKAVTDQIKAELKDHDIIIKVNWKLAKDGDDKVQAGTLGWVIRSPENLDPSTAVIAVKWKSGEDASKEFSAISTEWDFPNMTCAYSAVSFTSVARMPEGRKSLSQDGEPEPDEVFPLEDEFDKFRPVTWGRWIESAQEGNMLVLDGLSQKLMSPVDGYSITKAEGHRTRLFRVLEAFTGCCVDYGQGWNDPDSALTKLGVALGTTMRDLINDEDKIVDTDVLHQRLEAQRRGKSGDDYAVIQAAMVVEKSKTADLRGRGGGRGNGDRRTDAERKATCNSCGKRGHYARNCRSGPSEGGTQQPGNQRQGFRGRGTGAAATAATGAVTSLTK